MNKLKKKLSVIIPVYNEKNTIGKLLNKIRQLNIDIEIIVVNDASTDGTKEVLEQKEFKDKIDKLVHHNFNKGKGAAIQSAQPLITGDIVIIQDADLEYDPNDYYALIAPIVSGSFKVVYGSRVLGKNRYLLKNFSSLMRIFFNHLLSIISNILNNQNLTDAHTCYKVFDSDLFKNINLKEKNFNFCPEITTKIGLKKIKIKELPISYQGRSYKEGKKIQYIDGIKAIKTLFKYRFF